MSRGDAIDTAGLLPLDAAQALLLGRLWTSFARGPSVVKVVGDSLMDLSGLAPTMAELLSSERRRQLVAGHQGPVLCRLSEVRPESVARPTGAPFLLSPIDLQCIKACGVTFALSAVERVIEERAAGAPEAAARLRESLERTVGGSLRTVRPGTAKAAELKSALQRAGLWSQYLEVAIGPDAEVFTKGPVLSSIGWGACVGVRADSSWNNPEPEIVLICDSAGEPVGATLGNDVNLRDFEGRSALLLGKAKDNNASCALGPFIRLFDRSYGLDDVRAAKVSMTITGTDGYSLRGSSSMSLIARDPLELVRQCHGPNHQYPDGFALFLGTMFAPVEDRDEAGMGFTHKKGDTVSISSARLGTLVNQVDVCEALPPWDFGVMALMRNLAERGLLARGPGV